jgi:thiamine kinase-like enzyme
LSRLWAERECIYEALGKMPRSLCHGDFNYMNLFAPCKSPDESQTYAVDWQYAGIRPIGEDIAGLIADSSVVPVRRKAAKPREFTELVLEAYLSGINESGWRGDLMQVRFACVARLAFVWSFWLILGCGGDLLNHPVSEADRETQNTKLDVYVHTQEFLFQLADEARELLKQVTLSL